MKIRWAVKREMATHYAVPDGEPHAFPDVAAVPGLVVESLCGAQRIFFGSAEGRRWYYLGSVYGAEPECETCMRLVLLDELAE